MEHPLEPELEERLVAGGGPGGRVSLVDDLSHGSVAHAPGPSAHVELVVALRVGEGVERVATVAAQVVHLGRVVADEHVQPAVRDHGTDGMHARPALLPDRREIAETAPELVDQRPPHLRHLGCLGREVAPALHRFLPTNTSYVPGSSSEWSKGTTLAWNPTSPSRRSQSERANRPSTWRSCSTPTEPSLSRSR